ncbi:MAG: TonB-dependent receptor [Candidatus Eisenbacteria bacterium]
MFISRFSIACLPARALGALLGIAIAVGQGGASGGTPDALADLSLEDLMKVEIVYAASRYEQSTADAPSSVTIVTAEEIRAYGHRNLGDILRGVRGFYTTCDRNYQYIGVRGFGRPGDYNSRILLLLNGHRINENIYESALIGEGFPVDLDLVSRVEVIRGPSSSLYGTNAFFGVVNVVTKEAADLDGFHLTAEGGSAESYSGAIDYGERLRSGEEVLFSASFYDAAGNDLYFPEYDDPGTGDGRAVGVDGDGARRFFGRVAREGLVFESGFYSREKSIPTGAFETVFNDPRTKSVDSRGYAVLRYDHALREGTNLSAEAAYDWYGYDGDYAVDYGVEDDPYVVVNHDEGMARWWTGGLRLTRSHGERSLFTTGVEYLYNSRLDQTNYDEMVYLDDSRTSGIWAFHAQEDLSLVRSLHLSAGLRHDRYDTFGGTTSPRLGLIWTAGASTTLKGLYGRAFRAPNAYELYYNDGGEEGRTQKPNPELEPERITTYEMVLERDLGPALGTALSLWTFDTEDLIAFGPDPSDDLNYYHNVDRVTARGVEGEVRGRWKNGISGRVSYAFQETEDEATGKPLTNSPKHLVKGNVAGPFLARGVNAGVQVQYTSDRKTTYEGVADGFWVAHLTLSGRFLGERLELGGGVYNVFDNRYGDPGSEEHLQDLIEQDGRSYRIRLRCRL